MVNALIDAHGDDPESGYRFLAGGLRAWCLRRRAWRLWSQQDVWSVTVSAGCRGTDKSSGAAVHDDHVQHDFTADEPEQVRVTESPSTALPTASSAAARSALKDRYSS